MGGVDRCHWTEAGGILHRGRRGDEEGHKTLLVGDTRWFRL
jgi:hypothetical protein